MGKAAASGVGGLLGALGGGGSQQNVTSTTAPWQEQQPYLTDLFGGASDWMGNADQRQFFPGQTYAGFDPLQTSGQEAALGYGAGGLSDIAGQTQTGLGQMLSATPNMDVWGPVMESAMTRPIQAFTEQVLPAIRSGANQAGQYGSSRQGIAEGLGMDRLGQTLSDTQGRLAQAAAGEALTDRRMGMQMAPNVAQLGMAPSQLQQGIGGMRQGMEQMGISEDMARHDYGRDQQLSDLQAYQGMITGQYGGTQTQPYSSNPLMGGLGGALMGSQMGQGKGGGKGMADTGFSGMPFVPNYGYNTGSTMQPGTGPLAY